MIVIDNENQFLIVQLQGYGENDWNFVGGGLEKDESLEEGVKRELKEELNLDEGDYQIVAKSSNPSQYDFPEPILKEGIWYDGQIKEQFVVRFLGDKNKISLQEEEVKKHKWVRFKELKDHLIFPDQYENAVRVIKELIPQVSKNEN